jgi:hypothetical protein
MSKTSEKLNEAKFFLGQVEASAYKYPEFNFYLSAFLSSARSVLWIMKSEYQEVNGWLPWYENREPTLDEQLLLKRINAARIRTEKQAPIKAEYRIEVTIPKENVTDGLQHKLEELIGQEGDLIISEHKGNDGQAPVQEVNQPGVSFIGKVERVYLILDELGDEDILDVIKNYFSLIQKIVLESEEKFG